jgi:heme-degrading monooxygenase HmoA
MISRHWRGLAHPQDADAYTEHLQAETFPALKRIAGFQEAFLFRRDSEKGVEFLVVTTWESKEAIERFAGEDSEVAVVPERVQGWMIEYDRRARHYEIVEGTGRTLRVLYGSAVEQALASDVELIGVRWLNEDEDVELLLRVPTPERPVPARLIATWVTDFRMSLDLTGYVGVLPAWDATIGELGPGRWKVDITLRPGTIAFECNDLRLEVFA